MPDALTGLASHRDLPVHNRETTSILFDVDSLRWLNAQEGHEVADRALVAIAESLKRRCEKSPHAKPFRIWGDEFLVLLPSSGPGDAVQFATELIADVRAQNIAYSQPGQPGIDRLAISAVVFDLKDSDAVAISENGPSPAFRDWFETALLKEKRRRGAVQGVIVDVRGDLR